MKRRTQNSPGSITLICQDRPRGDTRRNSSFEISSCARAYVRVNYKKLKEIIHHVHMEALIVKRQKGMFSREYHKKLTTKELYSLKLEDKEH